MAKSPAHKFGQIIGDLLELALPPLLEAFAKKNNLYLDKKGKRPARKGKKVRWVDSYGNSHDLDFVLERNGAANKIGEPVAFIESAWRSYTRHSKNKAQEIQGAILPLVATHKNFAPFIGAILAGVFTDGALTQLKSLGFHILYFPYETVIKAFEKFGINAEFDESTTDSEVNDKIKAWQNLADKHAVAKELRKLNSKNVEQFLMELKKSVSRYISSVSVLPLHGAILTIGNIDDAIRFVKNYKEDDGSKPIVKYEISIKYNNGDKIEGVFNDKSTAIKFLESYETPKIALKK